MQVTHSLVVQKGNEMEIKLVESIREHNNNPIELERLYQENKSAFRNAIDYLAIQNGELPYLKFWKARFSYKPARPTKYQILFGSLGAVLIWILVRLYIEYKSRPIGNSILYLLPSLFWIFWGAFISEYGNKDKRRILVLIITNIVLGLYLFLLPKGLSQSSLLALIHSNIVMCYIVIRYLFDWKNLIDFMTKIGEFITWIIILMLSVLVISAITVGLFSLIEIDINDFYYKNIAAMLICTIPFVSAYIVFRGSNSNIAKTIIRIVSPIVSITLLVFLLWAVPSLESLINNRNTFIIYTFIPVVIIGMIYVSYNEANNTTLMRIAEISLILLLIVFSLLLLYVTSNRIMQWGITPNKVCVLGMQVIILVNAIMEIVNKVNSFKKRQVNAFCSVKYGIELISIWSLFVIFVIPVLFSFK